MSHDFFLLGVDGRAYWIWWKSDWKSRVFPNDVYDESWNSFILRFISLGFWLGRFYPGHNQEMLSIYDWQVPKMLKSPKSFGCNQSKLWEVGPEVSQKDERGFCLLNGLHITRNTTKELMKYTSYKLCAWNAVNLKGSVHKIHAMYSP